MEHTMPTVAARPNRRRDRLLTVVAAAAVTLLGWVVAVPVAGWSWPRVPAPPSSG